MTAVEPSVARLVVNPFLHVDAHSVKNPMTGVTLEPDALLYASLRTVIDGGSIDDAMRSELLGGQWLVREGEDLSRGSRLEIVSLETNTVCNQKCYFCPVSIDPREDVAMPDEMFHRIIGELQAFRETLQAVFLQSYNEPTVDRRFVEHCRVLFGAGLPVAVLTNASALTPAKIDVLVAEGPLRYMAVNLSTLDRDKYKHDRGADHLEAVLRNLEYARNRRVAEEMRIVVLGTGDVEHRRQHTLITERFAGSNFTVEPFAVMDRAGMMNVGLRPAASSAPLRGCDNVGSRPIQHLHITPAGACVLCCEDYDENYVVGDLEKQTIAEVLAGPELAQHRRWIYGIEEAPEEYMCRHCIYARRG